LRNLICFLIFSSDPQRSDSNQLELVSEYGIGREVVVDDIDGDKESLRVELVF
jgi:hypothetical protein